MHTDIYASYNVFAQCKSPFICKKSIQVTHATLPRGVCRSGSCTIVGMVYGQHQEVTAEAEQEAASLIQHSS